MSPLRTPESRGSQSIARRCAGLIAIIASMVAVPALSFAQTGTLTDDAYAAPSPVALTMTPEASAVKGLNWKGAWAATTDYVADDAVTFAGSSWRALRVNSNSIPVEGNDWTIIAHKGDAGSSNSGVISVTAASPISVSNPTTTPLTARDVPPRAGQYIQNSSALQSPAQFNIAGNATSALFDATTQFNLGGNRFQTDSATS